jgi:hypothetical protein
MLTTTATARLGAFARHVALLSTIVARIAAPTTTATISAAATTTTITAAATTITAASSTIAAATTAESGHLPTDFRSSLYNH